MIRDINDLKALKNRARSKVALRDPSLKNKVTVYNETFAVNVNQFI